jgi:GNAT superfamily N-acetyltransferase
VTGQIRPLPRDVGYAVREARGDDLDAIRELGLAAFPAAYEGVVEPELISLLLAKWWTKDALIPSIRAGRAFVAEDKAGRLLGMCSYGPLDGSYVLWKLCVATDARGRGVGGALLTAAQERAREAVVPLRITYTDGNRQAPAFCARHGFVEVGREEQTGMPEVVWMAQAGTSSAGATPAVDEREDQR